MISKVRTRAETWQRQITCRRLRTSVQATSETDSDDPMGEAFFQMTGVFAQIERGLIKQRTNEGLEAARARGRTGGRKAKLTNAQAAEVRRLYAAREKTVAEIGELFGITRESVYRYLKQPA